MSIIRVDMQVAPGMTVKRTNGREKKDRGGSLARFAEINRILPFCVLRKPGGGSVGDRRRSKYARWVE